MDPGARHARLSLALPAPMRPGDVRVLCDRAADLVRGSDTDILECDVALVRPDLVAVDALARVELTAGRLGCGVRLRGASVELLELLALCGLPIESVLEPERQPEEREEPRGVEEEGDATDSVA